MKIREFKNISNNVQVSDIVLSAYENAIEQIKEETEKNENVNNIKKFSPKRKNEKRKIYAMSKVAIIFGIIAVLSGSAIFSVKAYISHLEKMKNMEDAEVIELYETIFQYDNSYMSRALSDEEDRRFRELYDLYCKDMAEPDSEAIVISSANEYTGEGIAFCTEDTILYIPEREMSDEEILQLVVFSLLRQYVDYEAYVKATNPDYYLNYLEQMTMQEVEEIYVIYHTANTETAFFNRELSFDELGRRKVLKNLYKKGEMRPENTIPVIENEEEYSGTGIAFCKGNCTYYFPESTLNEEELLELIDFQIKADYCWQRINEEIESGIRSDWPYIEYVKRERIVTLDPEIEVDESLLAQPWLQAYGEVLEEYYLMNQNHYDDPERYYANVCFIYLNDDEVPEMLFSHGCTDFDYDDNCNLRNYLYTCKDGEAVLLDPGEDTMDDFYGYNKPFSYVERKSIVYCDYYYKYAFTTYDNETDIINNVTDSMSRMDVWDIDTLTRNSSNANIELLHAVYNYVEEEYADADFSYEYYINVSDIIRDETTGYVKEIVGEKVDRRTYEESEKALWNGEEITTLSVSDYDKIYSDDNILEALAKCYTSD